jgi:hypothetical protein
VHEKYSGLAKESNKNTELDLPEKYRLMVAKNRSKILCKRTNTHHHQPINVSTDGAYNGP